MQSAKFRTPFLCRRDQGPGCRDDMRHSPPFRSLHTAGGGGPLIGRVCLEVSGWCRVVQGGAGWPLVGAEMAADSNREVS